MRKIITAIAILCGTFTIANAQSTATNWTAVDCTGTSHTLFDDLDSGKIVVLVWVMPCGACDAGSKMAYNAVQSFATSHPGKVVYYLADDLGDAGCPALSAFASGNGIGPKNVTIFSNAGEVIDEDDFGGTGMPHVVVMGGTDHKIYFNERGTDTEDQAEITNAIDSVLNITTGVAGVANQINFTVGPNPLKDNIAISYDGNVSKVAVISMSGQVVKEISFATPVVNPRVSIDALPAGMYHVKMSDDKGKHGVVKVVVQ